MTNYKRIVSYLYRYENEEKTDNVGYVRVELRDKQCRVFVGIRDYKMPTDSKYKLCMYSNNDEGIFVENLYTKNGMEELKLTTDPQNVFGSKRSVSDIEGVFLYRNGEVIYLSQWTDRPVDFNNLMSIEEDIDQYKNEKILVEAEPKEDLLKVTENKEEKNEQESSITENINNQQLEKSMEENINKLKLESNITENINKLQSKFDIEGNINNQNNIYREEKIDEDKVILKYVEPEVALKNILETYPKLPAFDNNELFNCVRIRLNDIGLLSMENWKLGTNSFLVHGYYTYKYLMLGKVTFGDGKHATVLGIPGVFSSKEKYLANLFGFNQFVPVKKIVVKTGAFGYWITNIV